MNPRWLPVRNRCASRTLASVGVALIAMLAAPSALLAHAHLTKSTPAAAARLAVAPTSVRLWFSERPELGFTTIVLLGPDSVPIASGAPRRVGGEPLAVEAAIGSPLPAGTYTVRWQAAGTDGHPSRGRFSFVVLPSAGAPAADSAHIEMMQRHAAGDQHSMGGVREDDRGAESPAYVIVRWLSLISLLAMIGAIAFRWLVLPRTERLAHAHARGDALRNARASLLRRNASLGAIAAAILLVATIARFYEQSVAMHGGNAADVGMMGQMMIHTTWGTVWLLQLAAAITSLVALSAARVRAVSGERDGSGGWTIAAVAVLVLALTPALSGHAAAAPRLAALAVAADGVHVLGAGGWLGSLLVVGSVGIPLLLASGSPERGGLVADLVNAFSPTALAFSSLVVLTGVFAAWLHLGSVAALWTSGYGRTLLIKLALLIPALGTGAYNWLRVRPALGDVAAARRMRHSAALELTVGVLVIAVTAVLVAVNPPT